MAYDQPATRRNPKLIIFLVDESSSMKQTSGSVPKHQVVDRSVNGAIFELVTTFSRHDGVRDYVDLGVIGYGGQDRNTARLRSLLDTVSGAWTAKLSQVADMAKTLDNGVPRYVQSTPDGWTPMGGAMRLAGRLVDDWTREHPQSPAPVIVNITDGVPTDGSSAEGSAEDWAERLQELGTDDGACLLLNVGAPAVDGTTVSRSVFPDGSELPSDEGADLLWRMSSELPAELLERAIREGLLTVGDVADGRRLFAQGTDQSLLEKIFEFGTKTETPH